WSSDVCFADLRVGAVAGELARDGAIVEDLVAGGLTGHVGGAELAVADDREGDTCDDDENGQSEGPATPGQRRTRLLRVGGTRAAAWALRGAPVRTVHLSIPTMGPVAIRR